eukprot:gene5570-11211_t
MIILLTKSLYLITLISNFAISINYVKTSAPTIQAWDLNSNISYGINGIDESCNIRQMNITMRKEFQDLDILNTKPYVMCLRNHQDDMTRGIVKWGCWPHCLSILDVWRRKCTHKPQGLFVDIGANIGSCSLLLASEGANVVSFEPLSSNLHYFTKSILLNSGENSTNKFSNRIKLYPVGLGNKHTSLLMYSQVGNFGNSVVGKVVPDKLENENDMRGSNFTITISRLDDILWPGKQGPCPTISLLKIDSQGYESEVLDGAHNILSTKTIPIIMIEIAPKWLHAQGSSALKLCNQLESYGYILYREGVHVSLNDCRLSDIKKKNLGGKHHRFTQTYDILAILN